jgi:hypothetical protein
VVLLGWIGVLGLIGLLAWRLGRQPLAVMTLLAWLSLPIYNRLVLAGCPGDCGIRVDLVVVAPLLLILTVACLVAWWRSWRRKVR